MASCFAGSEESARVKSWVTRVALWDEAVEPEAANAPFAAAMAELNVLKKLQIADVRSDAVAAVESDVSALAATWLSDTADFNNPNFESCAVVESTSA